MHIGHPFRVASFFSPSHAAYSHPHIISAHLYAQVMVARQRDSYGAHQRHGSGGQIDWSDHLRAAF